MFAIRFSAIKQLTFLRSDVEGIQISPIPAPKFGQEPILWLALSCLLLPTWLHETIVFWNYDPRMVAENGKKAIVKCKVRQIGKPPSQYNPICWPHIFFTVIKLLSGVDPYKSIKNVIFIALWVGMVWSLDTLKQKSNWIQLECTWNPRVPWEC